MSEDPSHLNSEDHSQPCIFSSYGCPIRVSRTKQLAEHLEVALRSHIELLLIYISNVNNELKFKEEIIKHSQLRCNDIDINYNTLIQQTKHLATLSNLLLIKDNLIETQYNEIKRLRLLLLSYFYDKSTITNDVDLKELAPIGVIPKIELYNKLFSPLNENDLLPASNVETLQTHHSILELLVNTSINSMKVITKKWEEDFKLEQDRKKLRTCFLSTDFIKKITSYSNINKLSDNNKIINNIRVNTNVRPFMSPSFPHFNFGYKPTTTKKLDLLSDLLPGFNDAMIYNLQSDIKDANNKYPLQNAVNVIQENARKLASGATAELFNKVGITPADILNSKTPIDERYSGRKSK